MGHRAFLAARSGSSIGGRAYACPCVGYEVTVGIALCGKLGHKLSTFWNDLSCVTQLTFRHHPAPSIPIQSVHGRCITTVVCHHSATVPTCS
eukprot:5681645-Prymnesium_polylepis.1